MSECGGPGFGSEQLDEHWDARAPGRGEWGGRGPINPGHIAGGLGLLWLIYPFAALFTDAHASLARQIGASVLAAGFIVVVLWVIFGPEDEDEPPPTEREVWRVVGILAVLDVALALWDRPEWAATMSVYVIAFIAIPIPGVRGVAFSSAGVVLSGLLMVAAGWDSSSVSAQTLTIAGVTATLLAVGNVVRSNRELRVARAELARLAVDEERTRFARDLHDLLGHSLSLIAIKARLAQKLADSDPEGAAREVADIEEAARTSLTEVREAVTGYRRATIAGELAGARKALESAGMQMDAKVTRMPLGSEDEAVLAWALREATTNVVRHSGARQVVVRLEPAGDGARLLVDDDGRGSASAGVAGDGNGLRGLAERVAARRGRLETGPSEDGGFRVAVTLPGATA